MLASEVIVVGGGLVGLAAAGRLGRAGVGVTLLEGSERLGGRLGGGGGLAVDPVAHRLAGALPAPGCDELTRLVTGSVGPDSGCDRIFLDGRWTEAPLGGRRGIVEAVRPIVARKIWGLPEPALEPEAVTAGLSALGLVAPAVRSARRPAPPSSWRLEGGLARLVDALADGIVGAGGVLRLGCAVDGVRPDGDVVHVHTDDGAITTARQVVLALPLPGILGLLRDVPHAVRNAAAAQRWRSLVSVLLEVPGTLATDLDGRWFPGGDTPILRLAVVGAARPGPTAVVSAELMVTRDDPLWLASDDELVEVVRQHLVRTGLPDPAPLAVQVHRLADLLPVPRRGAQRHLAVVDDWLAGEPRLSVPGGPPLVPHHEPHRLLAAGCAAARSALAQLAVSSAMA